MKSVCLSPKDGRHYFFGYYDLQPYDESCSKHLAHRTSFMDRLPEKGDIAEVGYVDIATREFVRVGETRAWNFQQGAMLRWFENGRSIIYNDYDGKKYVSKIVDVYSKEEKIIDYPLATLSSDGKYGLSVNFDRIYDFRKGYGYCQTVDRFYDDIAPKDDGIILVDMQSGKGELICSYARLREEFLQKPFTDRKTVVNHITFSPSGRKFVFLFRNFYDRGEKWGTVLAVGDVSGRVKKLTDFEVNSHYCWRDDTTLMIYSGLPEWGVYFINTETGDRMRLNDKKCDRDDIHCNYSPDKTAFIGDGYPDKRNRRSLYYYVFKKKKSKRILKVYSEPVDNEIRCDLHARFSSNGKYISYDSTENGRREIRQIEFLK